MAVYRSRQKQLLQELVLQPGELPADGGPVSAAAAAQQVKYLAGGPAARTLDVVPSSEVLLMHLLCAVKADDLQLTAGEGGPRCMRTAAPCLPAAELVACVQQGLLRLHTLGPLARL
jgi:hypothetical protein